MPENQQKNDVVQERVAFGEKAAKSERRSGAGSHRSDKLTQRAQELANASVTKQAPSAVRPRLDPYPDSEAAED